MDKDSVAPEPFNYPDEKMLEIILRTQTQILMSNDTLRKDLTSIRESVIRMEERERLQDNVEHRKQTCPWSEVLVSMGHSLANGGKRFDYNEDGMEDHERRIAAIETLVLTKQTQVSLGGRIIEWGWKVGIGALVLERVAQWFHVVPMID